MSSTQPSVNYTQYRQVDVEIDRLSFPVVTRPGLPNWQGATPSDHLIARHLKLSPGARTVLFGCDKGIAAVVLAKQIPNIKLWMTDLNVLSLNCTKQTLQRNGILHFTVYDEISLLPQHKRTFNGAILNLPKGRSLGRRWLVEACELLEENGVAYLAGAKSEGIQSFIKDAEALFNDQASIVAYKKGHRLARVVKRPNDHFPEWRSEPGVAPVTWYGFQLELGRTVFEISTLPGVFSYQHLDEGTELLLKTLKDVKASSVLDVGCGYGIIGLTVSSLLEDPARMDLVDNNLYAVACAKRNLQHNLTAEKRSAIHVHAGDLLEDFLDRKYSLVLSNPPFHSGKPVDYSITSAMIQQASQVLQPGGRFVLVANQFIRYDQMLNGYFARVSKLAESTRFHVFEASHGI